MSLTDESNLFQNRKKEPIYTLGYIRHDENVFAQYLEPSLQQLTGPLRIISTSDEKMPAVNYNKIIRKAPTDVIILTHQDISFTGNLLECIEKTIQARPNFGVLGLVGVDSQHNYLWSKSNTIFEVETLDCCFIVIRKSHGIRFDSATFDDYHLYVEDYCVQAKKAGLKIYTLLINSNGETPSLTHHSSTLSRRGGCWGRYPEYKARLNIKWKRPITTT